MEVITHFISSKSVKDTKNCYSRRETKHKIWWRYIIVQWKSVKLQCILYCIHMERSIHSLHYYKEVTPSTSLFFVELLLPRLDSHIIIKIFRIDKFMKFKLVIRWWNRNFESFAKYQNQKCNFLTSTRITILNHKYKKFEVDLT